MIYPAGEERQKQEGTGGAREDPGSTRKKGHGYPGDRLFAFMHLDMTLQTLPLSMATETPHVGRDRRGASPVTAWRVERGSCFQGEQCAVLLPRHLADRLVNHRRRGFRAFCHTNSAGSSTRFATKVKTIPTANRAPRLCTPRCPDNMSVPAYRTLAKTPLILPCTLISPAALVF